MNATKYNSDKYNSILYKYAKYLAPHLQIFPGKKSEYYRAIIIMVLQQIPQQSRPNNNEFNQLFHYEFTQRIPHNLPADSTHFNLVSGLCGASIIVDCLIVRGVPRAMWGDAHGICGPLLWAEYYGLLRYKSPSKITGIREWVEGDVFITDAPNTNAKHILHIIGTNYCEKVVESINDLLESYNITSIFTEINDTNELNKFIKEVCPYINNNIQITISTIKENIIFGYTLWFNTIHHNKINQITETKQTQQTQQTREKEQTKEINQITEIKQKEQMKEIKEIKQKEQITEIKQKEQITEIKQKEQIKEIKQKEQMKEINQKEQIKEIKQKEQIKEIKDIDNIKLRKGNKLNSIIKIDT